MRTFSTYWSQNAYRMQKERERVSDRCFPISKWTLRFSWSRIHDGGVCNKYYSDVDDILSKCSMGGEEEGERDEKREITVPLSYNVFIGQHMNSRIDTAMSGTQVCAHQCIDYYEIPSSLCAYISFVWFLCLQSLLVSFMVEAIDGSPVASIGYIRDRKLGAFAEMAMNCTEPQPFEMHTTANWRPTENDPANNETDIGW